MIKRGQREGLVRRSVDPEVGIALLLGPFIYRRLFTGKLGRKAPEDLETHVAEAFIAAFGTTKSATEK